MNDLLLVLNPRRISECVRAIQELPVDKLWLRNMDEATIAERWPEILERMGGYERAFIISDDTVPRPHALAYVQELLDDGHPVATGYCNLGEDDLRVNLATRMEATISGEFPTLGEVQCVADPVIPTVFAGFCLTGMSVELWEEYPYELQPGGRSADRHLCLRLLDDGVPVVAHRDAFVWHVKQVWSALDTDPRKQLLIGVEPSAIDFDVQGLVAA